MLINQVFMDEKVILQVLAEQREEMSGYDVSGWISRPEEDFFEWDSDMAQVIQLDSSGIGVVIAGHNDGEKFGTKLFIMNPSDAARHSLERTGFLDTFNIIHSVTEVADAS